MTAPRLLEVGHVDRAHGIHGEVMVTLITDRTERLEPGSVLVVGGVERRVVASRPHQHRFIVRFAGVEDRSAAELLHGLVLYAEPIDDPDALWVHDLIGTRVIDLAAGGAARGVVVAVRPNPAHDLLELDTGALVPVVFVERCDPAAGVTEVRAPEGLFDV